MKFTAEQVQELGYGEDIDGFDFIWETEGEDRRWSRTMYVVAKHTETGKFYQVEYEQGLTEMQENMYEDQEGKEMKKVTKTVPAHVVTSYEAI